MKKQCIVVVLVFLGAVCFQSLKGNGSNACIKTAAAPCISTIKNTNTNPKKVEEADNGFRVFSVSFIN